MATTRVDLTPFGFTPTESLVYAALLGLGTASGYAVGKELNLARANVYQALHGLVSKGAAELAGDSPQRFEAVTPTTLMAQLARSQAERLDRLEQQLHGKGGPGATAVVAIESWRALLDLTLRAAARSPDPVVALAEEATLRAMAPIWRKRAADQTETRLWLSGPGGADLPIPASGVEPGRVEHLFGSTAVTIVVTSDAAIVAKHSVRACNGHWTSHPVLVMTIRGALLYIVGDQ